MNERSRELIGHIDVNAKVRELAKQSGCSIDKLGYGEGNLEKFAELIVRECAKRIDYWESRQGEHCDDLLKHFGVEK